MSTQETKLKAIADAIREKEGSTEPIPASAFAARILGIQTGSAFAVPLTVTVDPGAVVTAVNGSEAVSGTAGEEGVVLLTLTAPGLWTVTGTLGDVEKSTTVEVADGYSAELDILAGEVVYYGSAAPLSYARQSGASGTIGDYALFAGGYRTDTKIYVPYVDAYDSTLSRSSPTSLSKGRNYLASAAVGDFLLFAGGGCVTSSGTGDYVANVDSYDASLTRNTAVNLSKSRSSLSGASIGGYALFAGGNTSSYHNTVDVYDEALSRTSATVLSHARSNASSCGIGGHVLFAGRYTGYSSKSGAVDAYDAALTLTTLDPLSVKRYSINTAEVGNYALMVGGNSSARGFCFTIKVREVKKAWGENSPIELKSGFFDLILFLRRRLYELSALQSLSLSPGNGPAGPAGAFYAPGHEPAGPAPCPGPAGAVSGLSPGGQPGGGHRRGR